MLDEPLLQRCKTVFRHQVPVRGQTAAGFDCSGFVRFMYDRVFSMKLPRTSRKWQVSGKDRAQRAQTRRSRVFFQTRGNRISHVGIFVGNDAFVTANSSVSSITEDKLQQNYSTIRRSPSVCSTNHPRPAFFPATGKPCSVKRTAILRASSGSPLFFRFYCPILPDYAFRNQCLPHQLLAERQVGFAADIHVQSEKPDIIVRFQITDIPADLAPRTPPIRFCRISKNRGFFRQP